jgi:ribulose-5-phosphate 4-epimerase/fuculose-1-phosphate aldolase
MGKPAVATRTEAMEYFSEFVSLADKKEEWVEAIENELINDNQDISKARVAFAAEHTWENNVIEIYKLIANG